LISRHTDQAAIDYVRHQRDRCCMYGFFYGDPCKTRALHVHHIQKRSQLGPDHPDNLITLCAWHHDLAERHEITPEQLRHILETLSSMIGD